MNIVEFEKLKLHQRVRLVLKDVELCEKDPDIKFNMDTWKEVKGEKCCVCIAGALIHHSLKTSFLLKKSMFDSDIHFVDSSEIPNTIKAFDHLRIGDVSEFLEKSGVCAKYDLEEDLDIIYYRNESKDDGGLPLESFEGSARKYFKLMLKEVADYLEKRGI